MSEGFRLPQVWPNQLRALREKMGAGRPGPVLLEDVAKALDMSVGYLSRIERGMHKPSDDMLARMGEFYGVAPDDLGADETVKPALDERRLLGAFLRQRRIKMGYSMAKIARTASTAKGRPVSESFVRNIEAGFRPFSDTDPALMGLLAELKIPDLDTLASMAREAFDRGGLDTVADDAGANPLARTGPGVRLFHDGPAPRRAAPLPARLERALLAPSDEYVVRIDRSVVGGVPGGSYLIARDGERPSAGDFAVAWVGEQPQALRVVDDDERGLIGLRERPRREVDLNDPELRLEKVVAIVM